MKVSNIFLKFILPIFTCFLSFAAVILGSIAVAKVYEEPKFSSVESFIRPSFINQPANGMFVSWKGNIYDTDKISTMQNGIIDIIQYQRAVNVRAPKNIGSTEWTVSFSWTDEENGYHNYIEFIMYWRANGEIKLRLYNDDYSCYIYSDCLYELDHFVRDMAYNNEW